MTYPQKPEKASAKDVIRKITKQSDPAEITAAVDAALRAQYENAVAYQRQKGRTVNLTEAEFFALITPSRRKRMEKAMAERKFERFMKSNYGYVLTWKNRKAYKGGVMDKDTAAYINREDSERATQFGPGDTHTDESIDLIRKARTGTKATEATRQRMSNSKKGKPRDDEARANISAGLKGKPKDPAHIERMRESAKARWAAHRAAKEAGNQP